MIYESGKNEEDEREIKKERKKRKWEGEKKQHLQSMLWPTKTPQKNK